jgi:rhomboid protease GluP
LAFNPSAALQDKANLLSLGSPDPRVQLLLGATGGASWFCGQHWTLLTANFLHGSALHIFFNMLWLRNLGPISSQLFGPARFFVIFMLTGIGGFALSNWGDPLLYLVIGEPFSPIPPGTLGASASIFGLMGVLIGYGRREGGAFGAQLTRQLLTWAIALFVLGLVMSGVNNLAHLGGFITGYLLSFALPPRGQRSPERPIAVVAIFLAILTLASMAMSFISWWSYVFENEIPQCLY